MKDDGEKRKRMVTGPTGDIPPTKKPDEPVPPDEAPSEPPEDGDLVVSLEGHDPVDVLRHLLRGGARGKKK